MYSDSRRALLVVNVHAPDPAKNFEEYEKFTQMLTRVMLGGRKEGARRYFVAGDHALTIATT